LLPNDSSACALAATPKPIASTRRRPHSFPIRRMEAGK
jgi:hypothetical protein